MDLLFIMPVEFNKQIDATFDSTALQEFADQLYSRAGSIVLECVAGYTGIRHWLFVRNTRRPPSVLGRPQLRLNLNCAGYKCHFYLIGIIIGIVKGRAKRFQLKLEAQKLLIQMRIEENIWKVFPANCRSTWKK